MEYIGQYSNRSCWTFIMGVSVTVVIIILCILGFANVLSDKIAMEYWTGLFTFTVGVWMPHPDVPAEKVKEIIEEIHASETDNVDNDDVDSTKLENVIIINQSDDDMSEIKL